MIKRVAAFLLILLLGGCATGPVGVSSARTGLDTQDPTACRQLFEELDQAVNRAGVRDAQYTRIRGFPSLRTDRNLASFRHQAMNRDDLALWLNALRERDREARRYELANLPRAHWPPSLPWPYDKLADPLDRCGSAEVRDLLSDANALRELRSRLSVPADYSSWQRALGLYPVAGRLALRGAKRLYAELARDFRVPLSGIPTRGRRIVYAPSGLSAAMSAHDVRQWLARHQGFDTPTAEEPDTQRLLMNFAPIWVVDASGDYDRIGAPTWRRQDFPTIDSSQPIVFYHFSKTRAFGRSLWQIDYSVWFSKRPSPSALDLYGGRLDGLIWRVTLGEDGKPLIYDSIHHCGCYHTFLPTAALRRAGPQPGLTEPLFAPQTLRDPLPGEHAHLYLAGGTHYLQQARLAPLPSSPRTHAYRLAAYDELRSLPAPGGRRSLFDPDGLIAGTQRTERFLFWPLGIANSGAMRQWGRHATAFVGQRHFDDPYLIDRYFRVVRPGSQ
jgi:hypothetical protein